MSGSFNVSQVWFAREAMTPLKRLILGELLRQFLSPSQTSASAKGAKYKSQGQA